MLNFNLERTSRLFFIIIILSFNSSFANESNSQSKITKNLRCLICQGQSVYDSDSDFANSVKILVEKKKVKLTAEMRKAARPMKVDKNC